MIDQSIDPNKSKIAILIDGENAQPSLIGKILTESAKYGSLTIRRIYGDWTKPQLKPWKGTLHNNAIQPIQQFRFTTGKNSTDSALIIDAMDILHEKNVDGFCIVSSDSDYTRLATRIRETGIFVMGIGEKKTPKAFINACNVFVYTENLSPLKNGTKSGNKKTKTSENKVLKEISKESEAIPILKEAFEMAVKEDGWANLAEMGNHLRKLDPGFDPRTFGYKSLSQLINSIPTTFKIRSEKRSGLLVLYIKLEE
jgi:uncharacterized LabA/DUF88 family protein